MNYLLQCQRCEARCWTQGAYDSEVNTLDLNDNMEWESSCVTNEETFLFESCNHEEYEIIDDEPFDYGDE